MKRRAAHGIAARSKVAFVALAVVAPALTAGCASEKVEGVRVPLNTRRIPQRSEVVSDSLATVSVVANDGGRVSAATAKSTPFTSVDTPVSSTTGGTGTSAQTVARTASSDGTARLQTTGLYNCGSDPAKPKVVTYFRFKAGGAFFAVSLDAAASVVREWLGIDTTKVPPGMFIADGAAFFADTFPGLGPGVLVTGQVGEDGSLSVHTRAEPTPIENDLTCTFSPD